MLEKKFNFKLDNSQAGLDSVPIDLMKTPKFSTKYLEAQITRFDYDRYQAINFVVEWMIKLEFVVSEGLFNDGLFLCYQILRVSRYLNDFAHILEVFQMFANLLLKSDCSHMSRVLNYMADLSQETNQLGFLIDAYLRIGQQLTESQDYDKAIRVFKKMLKVCWLQGDSL